MSTKVVAFVGRSGSGKTTLITRIIPEFRKLNLRVGTLKHTHHDETFDRPKKDSWQHRKAGAEQVMLLSDVEMALFADRQPELSIEEIAAKWFAGYDLLIIEGFKHAPVLKVEVYRKENPKTPLYTDPAFTVEALVTNADPPFPVPHFSLEDTSGLVEWLAEKLDLKKKP